MSRSAPGGLDEKTDPPEAERPWWPAVVVLGGAALVGLALRFYPDTPFWLDEALSVNIARLPIGEIPAALRLDGHPPLYYVLLHGWMSVLGESDTAVRALSALFSVLTVPLLWWVLRPRGERVAWVAAGLLAASPFAIRYATEARMYSLVMLLVVAGWLAVERSIERPSFWRLAGVAACTGLLLLTHYWSMFLLAAVGIVLLWAALRRGVTAAWKVIAAMVVGGLAFLPWVPSFLTQLQHTGTPWGEASRPADVIWLSAVDFVGGPFSEPQLAAALLLALVVVGLFGRRDPAPAPARHGPPPGGRRRAARHDRGPDPGDRVGRVAGVVVDLSAAVRILRAGAGAAAGRHGVASYRSAVGRPGPGGGAHRRGMDRSARGSPG